MDDLRLDDTLPRRVEQHGGPLATLGHATLGRATLGRATLGRATSGRTVVATVAEEPRANGLLAGLGGRHAPQLHVGGVHKLRAPVS